MHRDIILNNPLEWPAGVARTMALARRPSKFHRKGESYRTHRRTMAEARDYVELELERLGASRGVVRTNVPINQDGYHFTAGRRAPEDPGAAVYFELEGQPRTIAIDIYTRAGCNLWAIGRSIEALRQLERDGGPAILRAATSGLKMLPESTSGRSWWDVLELERDTTGGDVRGAYRRLAKVRHPDTGGTDEAFAELAEAMRQGLSATEGRVA